MSSRPREGYEEIERRLERIMEEEYQKRRKKVKDEEYYKVRQLVFDTRTVRALLKLFNKGVLRDITWIVSAGKEAVVMAGRGREGDVAIKVYRVATANFRKYLDYIVGDYRFVPVKDRDRLIRLWAKKEFRNLVRMYEAGVRVPKPMDVVGNILVMQFIGDEGFPAPLLREIRELSDPRGVMEDILAGIRASYLRAELVHGDLSEYNIMYWRDLPWIIDVSQAVVTVHPMAEALLRRDVERVIRFFNVRFGISGPDPWEFVEELLEEAG